MCKSIQSDHAQTDWTTRTSNSNPPYTNSLPLALDPHTNPTLRQLHPAHRRLPQVPHAAQLRRPLLLHHRGHLRRRQGQNEVRQHQCLDVAEECGHLLRPLLQKVPHRAHRHHPVRDQPAEEPQELRPPHPPGDRAENVRHRGLLIYISINIQLTNPNSLNTQSTPIFSIPNDNNILSPFNDVTSNWTNFIVSLIVSMSLSLRSLIRFESFYSQAFDSTFVCVCM